MKKTIKTIILILYLFINILLCTSINWATKVFAFLNFEEIIFQITTPLRNTESSIMKSYFGGGLFNGVLITLITSIIVIVIYHFLSVHSTEIDIKLWKKKIAISINNKILRVLFTILIIIIPLLLSYYSLNTVGFTTYIKKNYLNDSIDFFEKNYVDPKTVEITFPEKKRNLIYIYVESLETSFFDEEHGGINSENVMAPLEELTSKNTMFSENNNRGGFYSYEGTNYTSGSLVAQTAGIPLKISPYAIDNSDGKYKTLVPGAYTINEVLEKEGYNQTFMIGSSKEFGSRDTYFYSHGNTKIFDYHSAINSGKIPKDYNVWWGFEDSKLFEYAKEEVTNLSKENKPFNLSLLTTGTHHPDGYTESSCSNPFKRHYSNAIFCSAEQIRDFVYWIQDQDFYDNTTIIIVGDHFTYKTDYIPYTNRAVYNLIINSAIEEQNSKNRLFSPMDMYPTTLAALGAKIEGEQLGVGINLYSGKQTMSEKYGVSEYNNLLSYSSNYYLKNILIKKEGK